MCVGSLPADGDELRVSQDFHRSTQMWVVGNNNMSAN